MRFLWACLLVIGCRSEPVPKPVMPPPQEASVQDSQRPPPGTLWRDDVDAVVDGGLGRFLGFVTVEPRLEGDTFVGWQIVELRPVDTWTGVDLAPGDVVTRINGRPLERETQAFDAFRSLKGSDKLVVSYLRGEEAREIVWRIVPRPGVRPPPPVSSTSATTPAPSAAPIPTVPAKK